MTAVPVLSLWQPWASLIAVGVKTIETRSWKAPKSIIGQTVAIHATKRKPKEEQRVGEYTVHEMADGSWAMQRVNSLRYIPLPLGAIVATARLDGCVPIKDCRHGIIDPPCPDAGYSWRAHVAMGWGYPHADRPALRLYPDQRTEDEPLTDPRNVTDQLPYGDFTEGRFAWILSDVERLATPVPFRGGQSFSRKWERP